MAESETTINLTEISSLSNSTIPDLAETPGNNTTVTSVPTLHETPFYLNFKDEPWVIPLVSLALFNIAAILIFEIYVLYKSCGGRRHLFLGQILLLGLFFCSILGILYVPQPHWILCGITRAGLGIVYTIVYGTLLVKCVFLLKLHDGVYFNASFQALILFFVVAVEVAIITQWMVYEPSDIISFSIPGGTATTACRTMPLEKILYLSYVMLLLFLVIVGSIRARSLRENNKEALYIGLSIAICLVIWVSWTSVALIFDRRYDAPAEAFGLISTCLVVFLLIFIPKAVQLANPKGDLGSGSTVGSPSVLHTPSFLHLHANAVLPTTGQGTLVKQSQVNADYCRGYASRFWRYDYPSFQQMEAPGMTSSEMNSLKKLNGSFHHSHLY